MTLPLPFSVSEFVTADLPPLRGGSNLASTCPVTYVAKTVCFKHPCRLHLVWTVSTAGFWVLKRKSGVTLALRGEITVTAGRYPSARTRRQPNRSERAARFRGGIGEESACGQCDGIGGGWPGRIGPVRSDSITIRLRAWRTLAVRPGLGAIAPRAYAAGFAKWVRRGPGKTIAHAGPIRQ